MEQLDQLRESIREKDFGILELSAKRSKYPISPDFFTERHWPQNSALRRFAKDFYLEFARIYCKEETDAEYPDDAKRLDEELILKLMQRTGMGRDVARLKSPRGLPVLNAEVEEKKLSELKEAGKIYGLEPGKVESAFLLVFKESKRIQEQTALSNPCWSEPSPLIQYIAGTEMARGALESQARDVIEKLSRNGNYSMKTAPVEKSVSGKTYIEKYLVQIFEV